MKEGIDMTGKGVKRAAESIGYLFSHPYKSLLGVLAVRDRDAAAYDVEGDAFPEIELSDITGEKPIHLDVCSFLSGGSTVPDYALLKGACEFCASRHGSDYLVDYMEIGTWRGESIINVMGSESVGSAYSVTLDVRELVAGKGVKETEAQAERSNSNFFLKYYQNEKFHQVFADSLKFDFSKLNKKFDVIFIDGNHSYEAILNDTKKALPLLKDEHSIIIWHDYLYEMDVLRPMTLKAIRDGMPKETYGSLYHVKNTIAAVYIQEKFSSAPAASGADIPTSGFGVEIKQHMLR